LTGQWQRGAQFEVIMLIGHMFLIVFNRVVG